MHIIAVLFVLGCQKKNNYHAVPILDKKHNHIGDSVFCNGILSKVVFVDSMYIIDSIVYERYDNQARNLKSIRTYSNGVWVFENIEYFENGRIKEYVFKDEENEDYFYLRKYNEDGVLIETEGELFFQGYLDGLDFNTLEVKFGKDIDIKVFYPNPPDCDVFLYVKGDNNEKWNVFHGSKYIDFLQSVSVKNDTVSNKWNKIDICIDLKNKSDYDTYCGETIYYKVVR